MADLTAEQLEAAGKMSMDELRAAALAEAAGTAVTPPAVTTTDTTDTKDKPRDDKGRFSKSTADIQNEPEEDEEEVEDDEEPVKKIYRREIPNGDGSFDVYEGETPDELIDAIAKGKENANKKIQEFIAERKTTVQKTAQQIKDENYLVEQNLKTDPKNTIKELAKEALAEEAALTRRSNEAQSRFVNTHPDFIPSTDNGNRLAAEVQRLGYTEFTTEGLEKAYQSLKKSGLLQLKAEEASGATEEEAEATERTAQPTVDATQQRSSKKGSNIPTRHGSRAATPRVTGPTEDEAYKLPMDQLRALANKQLAETNRN